MQSSSEKTYNLTNTLDIGGQSPCQIFSSHAVKRDDNQGGIKIMGAVGEDPWWEWQSMLYPWIAGNALGPCLP